MVMVITLVSRTKLDRVREEMAAIGARSARLRQRAARLQEEKQRESMGRWGGLLLADTDNTGL